MPAQRAAASYDANRSFVAFGPPVAERRFRRCLVHLGTILEIRAAVAGAGRAASVRTWIGGGIGVTACIRDG